MEVNFTVINIITLFGAIQGFTLCLILYVKNKNRFTKVKNLILFVFSLSFLNFFYALLDAQVLELYKPLYLFPFPYKYLIGVAFFFYVIQNVNTNNALSKRYNLLFIPALVYGILHMYWFSISVYENSYRITAEIIATDFFRINELVYLAYTIILILVARRYLSNHANEIDEKYIRWFQQLTLVFLIIIALDFSLYVSDLIIHNGQETLLFYYPNFILNSALIYWVGIIGFLRPELLAVNISKSRGEVSEQLKQQLVSLFETDHIYLNKKLTINNVAQALGIKEKELSHLIKATFGLNFSQLLNKYRVARVKELIASDKSQKYTMVALAEDAGFSSKSSFYSVFKQLEGITPAAFKTNQNFVQNS